MKKLSITILLSFIISLAISQNIKYATKVLYKLSSEEFKGRGYVDNGDKIAANYIKNQLDSLGVKSFGNNYFQDFSFPINTFPNKIFLSINGKELSPGKDFLIDLHSGECKGKFDIKTIELSKIDEYYDYDLSKKFIVIIDDVKCKVSKKEIKKIVYANVLKARGYILLEDNLIHEQSQVVNNYCIIKIKKEVFDEPLTNLNIDAKNKFYESYKSQNLIGYIKGDIDSFIVFTAHYDHLGKLGERATFYGANDNGSGSTMVLNLADYYSHKKPHYTIVFMFFSGEEVGLLGSIYNAENPVFDLKKVKFLFNLDMVGTGQKGIRIVNSTVFNKEFDLLNKINNKKKYLVDIKKRGEAANSDHYPFYAKGVHDFFIYTLGGSKQYHNIYDKPEQLSLFAFKNLEKLLIEFVKEYK